MNNWVFMVVDHSIPMTGSWWKERVVIYYRLYDKDSELVGFLTI